MFKRIKKNSNSIDFIIKDNNIIFDKNILKFENQPPILAPRDYQLKIYEKAKNGQNTNKNKRNTKRMVC